jgi:hypothetical protein
MHLTKITFPQLTLPTRDGHKLRGYFANQFGEESDLFHNHTDAGKVIYRYPRIQYKIIRGTPTLVGIDDGGQLLVERFLRMKAIEINGQQLPCDQKNLKSEEHTVGVNGQLHNYQFLNPWLPINQKNHREYLTMNLTEQKTKLQSILINHMIAFFKAIQHQETERIMVNLQLEAAGETRFKDQNLLAFKGSFVTNVQLPDHIGLGKSTARGFGAIEKII